MIMTLLEIADVAVAMQSWQKILVVRYNYAMSVYCGRQMVYLLRLVK